MISFIQNKGVWQHVECDDIVIPDYGVNVTFTDGNCFPFIYGFDNNGKDFVLLGERGGTHAGIFSDFKAELEKIGINSRYKVLCARIWNINPSTKKFPKKIITLWADDTPEELTSSKSFARINELLKYQNINISNASIAVDCENNIILEDYGDVEDGIYIISLSDYIFKNFSSVTEIPKEYLREKRKRSSGVVGGKPSWHDLPYRLYRWQSDEGKTIKISQKVIVEIVRECLKEILKENKKMGS